MTSPLTIREAKNHDMASIVALIDSVLREYGDAICLTGSESDLLDIESNYFQSGGAFWVLEQADAQDSKGQRNVLGTHAAIGLDSRRCILKRLYLAPDLRGTKWGAQLMQAAIDWARQHEFKTIQFWSDTRFSRAHRFFEKFGFKQTGEIRSMNDSHSTYQEYFYILDLS